MQWIKYIHVAERHTMYRLRPSSTTRQPIVTEDRALLQVVSHGQSTDGVQRSGNLSALLHFPNTALLLHNPPEAQVHIGFC